jgi:hypothetical protein
MQLFGLHNDLPLILSQITEILVPAIIGFPLQISGSTMIELFMFFLELFRYDKQRVNQKLNLFVKRLKFRFYPTKPTPFF